jgi:hypothetical protein
MCIYHVARRIGIAAAEGGGQPTNFLKRVDAGGTSSVARGANQLAASLRQQTKTIETMDGWWRTFIFSSGLVFLFVLFFVLFLDLWSALILPYEA